LSCRRPVKVPRPDRRAPAEPTPTRAAGGWEAWQAEPLAAGQLQCLVRRQPTRLAEGSQQVRIHLNVVASLPASRPPEQVAKLVGPENEDMTLENARLAKACQTLLDQRATNSSASLRGGHRQVMDVTPPAVMSAKRCAYETAVSDCDPAESGVASQEACQVLGGVRLAQLDPVGLRP